MRFRRLFRLETTTARVDREIDDELAFHFVTTIDDLTARGWAPDDARREAERRFGNVREHRERLRTLGRGRARVRRRADLIDVARQQFRLAVRGLRRQPLVATAIVVTFALGLGANAAIFTVLDRLLLRPPTGVADPAQVHRIYYRQPARLGGEAQIRSGFFFVELAAIRQALGTAGQAAAHDAVSGMRIGRGRDAPHADANYVSQDYFRVLGVRPAMGRAFTTEETDPLRGPSMVAIISDHLWRSVFDADEDILGKSVELDGDSYTIVGVAPPGFNGVDISSVGVWLPASVFRLHDGDRRWATELGYATWMLVVRSAPGTSVDELAERLRAGRVRALAPLARAPTDTAVTMIPSSLLAARGPAEHQSGISIAFRLGGVAVLVLLIACANVANLLLARALQRRREIAVRLALGISRSRLAGQLVLESLLLAFTGAAAALLLAYWAGGALRAQLLPYTSFVDEPVDGRIVWFTVAIALVTGIVAGLAPALRAGRTDVAAALHGGAREGVRRSRVRGALVALQAALSVVLLVGTGLFVRSLQRASAIDPGFDMRRLVAARLSRTFEDTSRKDLQARVAALVEHARRLPGVERVATASFTPLGGYAVGPLRIDGADSIPRSFREMPTFTTVSSGFFETTGLRIVRGRPITDADTRGSERVAVVNEAMARRFWPGMDPIGRCIRVDEAGKECTRIVGIAESSPRMSLTEESALQYYLPGTQHDERAPGTVLLRMRPDRQANVVRTLDRELRALDPDGSSRAMRVAETLDRELRPWRLGAVLFGVCGVLALIVATLGIYSTVSYDVTQRRHELGVRAALGAQLGDVVRLVLSGGMRSVVVGVGLGIALSLAGGRFVEALLYGTSTRDPLVLAAIALALLAAGALACLVPAWRSGRVDPMEALRVE